MILRERGVSLPTIVQRREGHFERANVSVVPGWLKLYRCLPREQIRVFVITSPHLMDVMLSRANNGLFSTAITPEQLWDSRCMSWIEIRRLEIELGSVGDHDQPYSWNMPPCGSHLLTWTRLLSRRERGEIEP